MKVLKFGGTSLASPSSIKRVAEIIKNSGDCVVVVSAPGKRYDGDEKITDLLLKCYRSYLEYGRCDGVFKEVVKRFDELTEALGVTSLAPLLTDVRNEINGGKSIGYAAGRGEYLCAKMIAEYTGYDFVDAIGLIKFTSSGEIDYQSTYRHIRYRLGGGGGCVVPGFYGVLPNGIIKTFSRGGSDITGSLIAAALSAEVYENWTDVNGFYFASPMYVKDAPSIPKLSRNEMKSLSLMGAQVLHYGSIEPLKDGDIPVVIKNTFDPSFEGSVISEECGEAPITGVALKGNAELIRLDSEKLFAVLSLLKDKGIFALPLPSLPQAALITDEFDEELMYEVSRAAGVDVACDKIAVITAVGENLKDFAPRILSRITALLPHCKFAVMGGGISLLWGVQRENCEEVYSSVAAALLRI